MERCDLPRPDQGKVPEPGQKPLSQSDQESVPLRGSLRPRGPIRFDMTVRERSEAIWLHISGELDILTVPRLASELNTIVRRTRHDVVLDLREANFVDSAGLQLLLGTQRRLTQASRSFTVVCDEGPVKRLIQLTRLEDILGLMSGLEAEGRMR